jgi:hypothetical protein
VKRFVLFFCNSSDTKENDEEREKLQICGQFHVGDKINVFRRASLAMQQIAFFETSVQTQGCILYGTIDGAIGIFL